MGLPTQEYWSGLPFPFPGDLSNPGIELASPVLAGEFFTTETPGKLTETPGKLTKMAGGRKNYSLSPNEEKNNNTVTIPNFKVQYSFHYIKTQCRVSNDLVEEKGNDK